VCGTGNCLSALFKEETRIPKKIAPLFFLRSLTDERLTAKRPCGCASCILSLHHDLWSMESIVWSIIPQVYTCNRFIIYRRPSHSIPISILILSGSASRGVHHNIIGLKGLDELAKSSEFAL
jgi:hypothetical protein